ncbi:hypothetical protein FRC04_003910 [Tulasnella sp. 424]|nr:hypothetical protein FRC04_003910 [Tulasnella sp. 424]
MYKQDKATTERNARILRELVKRPENKLCADCKRHDPRWASWNIGVFVCIRCSGIHRSMGTHISKVKSVDLDTWTPEQMASIQKWGNRRANVYWEAHLKAGHVPPDHKVESFIRSKYESRRWAMEGPPPEDPSILDQEQAAQEPAPTPAVQAIVAADSQSSSPRSQSPANAGGRTAHPLLSTAMMSTNRAKASPTSVSPAPVTSRSPPPPAPAPPAPAPAVDDLFSLDFHAPAPGAPTGTNAAATSPPRKDVKNDIMSLFSTSSPPVAQAIPNSTAAWGGANAWGAPAQQPAATAASADPWGSFTSAPAQSTNQSFFGSPPGQQGFGGGFGAFQQPTSNASLFGSSSNVWANPAANPAPAASSGGFGGAGIWGQPASAAPTQPAAKKQDDAFGDLWS